jgi:Zn/Cd-binding protein ZinT
MEIKDLASKRSISEGLTEDLQFPDLATHDTTGPYQSTEEYLKDDDMTEVMASFSKI